MQSFLNALYSAWTLLTTIPVPQYLVRRAHLESLSPSRAAIGFVWVGVVLAGIMSLIASGIHWSSVEILSIASIIVLVILTGALHEDGFSDFADALGVRHDRSRMLKVMKDPQLGVFGALALVLLCFSRFVLLTALAVDIELFISSIFAWLMLSRWAPLFIMFRLPYLRNHDGQKIPGTSEQVDLHQLAWAALPLLALLLFFGVYALIGLCLLVLASCELQVRYYRRLLGGYTGDVLGCSVILTEIVVLTWLTL